MEPFEPLIDIIDSFALLLHATPPCLPMFPVCLYTNCQKKKKYFRLAVLFYTFFCVYFGPSIHDCVVDMFYLDRKICRRSAVAEANGVLIK